MEITSFTPAQYYYPPMMYHMFYNGWGFGGFMGGFLGTIFMVLFWVMIILAVVYLVKYFGQGQDGKKEKTPMDILKERYAKGEIDKDEFEKRKSDLEK